MQRLDPLEPAAPDESRELLDAIIVRRGEVGDMVRTMAHSPTLLQGYLASSRAMKSRAFPSVKRGGLAGRAGMARLRALPGCAHRSQPGCGLSDTDIALARQGVSTGQREAALIAFAVRILAELASITDDDVAELSAHGWSDRIIAELVGLVVLNLMTGAFNLVAGIEPAMDVASVPGA